MKLVSLFSGGKDSMMALHYALKFHEVKFLLSFIADPESYMFHYPNIELARFSADALEIPIIMKKLSQFGHHLERKEKSECSKEKELESLRDALKDLKNLGIEGVATGVVTSNYQYGRIKKICDQLNLNIFAPYWQKSHEDLIKEALNLNFKIIFVGVYADGFNEKWLGRVLDRQALKELKILEKKFKINIGGEGGEYETFVLDCPLFKKEIVVLEAEKIWDKTRGEFLIKRAEFRNKN